MATFRYFAYGSNMLTSRLSGRCRSSAFVTVAKADGCRLEFSKRSIDGSGKATIVHESEPGQSVFGAVFDISTPELETLDDFEGIAYERRDISVTCVRSGEELGACTYLALVREDGLAPYDWYLALVIAGLVEHRIDREYAAAIRAIGHEIDTRVDRKERRAAIRAFEQAGIRDYRTLLCQTA